MTNLSNDSLFHWSKSFIDSEKLNDHRYLISQIFFLINSSSSFDSILFQITQIFEDILFLSKAILKSVQTQIDFFVGSTTNTFK
jgi:hypothetical protein